MKKRRRCNSVVSTVYFEDNQEDPSSTVLQYSPLRTPLSRPRKKSCAAIGFEAELVSEAVTKKNTKKKATLKKKVTPKKATLELELELAPSKKKITLKVALYKIPSPKKKVIPKKKAILKKITPKKAILKKVPAPVPEFIIIESELENSDNNTN